MDTWVFEGGAATPAPSPAEAGGASGHRESMSLIELVLRVAQVQYEMQGSGPGGPSQDDLRALEGPLIEELHRRGVPISHLSDRLDHTPFRRSSDTTPGS